MKRLYTFGCSVTQHIWPTWADILGREFDYFENWARGGAGNLYIFNSIVECVTRNNLTEGDTVIIMWSGITRVDHYHSNDWQPQGSDFDLTESDIRGHEIINFAYVTAIKNLLELKKIKYRMFSISEFIKDDDVYDFYKESVDCIVPSEMRWEQREVRLDKTKVADSYFFNIVKKNYDRNKGSSWPEFEDYFLNNNIILDSAIREEIGMCLQSFKKGYTILSSELVVNDSHPSPEEHLKFLTRKLPDFSISQNTKKWVEHWNTKISEDHYAPFRTAFPKQRL